MTTLEGLVDEVNIYAQFEAELADAREDFVADALAVQMWADEASAENQERRSKKSGRVAALCLVAGLGLTAAACGPALPQAPGEFTAEGVLVPQPGCDGVQSWMDEWGPKTFPVNDARGARIRVITHCAPDIIPEGHQAMNCGGMKPDNPLIQRDPRYALCVSPPGTLVAAYDANIGSCPAAKLNELYNLTRERKPDGSIGLKYTFDPFGYCGEPGNPLG